MLILSIIFCACRL